MPLREMQQTISRLLTDSSLRDRFLSSGVEGLDDDCLSLSEREQIAALDRRQLARFAKSLQLKRWSRVRNLLPGTARCLGASGRELFFAYCNNHAGHADPLNDALGLAEYLGQGPGAELPDFLSDLLRLEYTRATILMAQSYGPSTEDTNHPHLTSRARILRCRHDWEVFYPQLIAGREVNPPHDPCALLLGQHRGHDRVKLKRINETTARLLEALDGTRSWEQVMRELSKALQLSAEACRRFRQECQSFCERLAAAGLLSVEGAQADFLQ